MYKLRDYQDAAVKATIKHFQADKSPAVIVLPTGAGKSLVIAELARLARGRVLVLAHVKELVEQNHDKFKSFGLEAGIYSAGLRQKDFHQKVIFGSIQSVARAEDDFFNNFSLLVIDECHRVSVDGETQYFQVIDKIKKKNPEICILGLTATPYRLGYGWIYNYSHPAKILRTQNERFFKKCIYDLSVQFMIKNGYLTPPVQIDSPVASYDFSSLKIQGASYITSHIEQLLKDQKRITPVIVNNIVEISENRQGVMIFTSSVNHAIEIMQSLPPYVSALVVGDTESKERDEIIAAFKRRDLKFLVNVSVLTTGFDAPHVDVIAILRPTESVSLYQQIVGRGLRLSPGKEDCLILDYTGQGHNIFHPEIEGAKPHSNAVPVEVICPACGVQNSFWGIKDPEGEVIEHFGRKCQGAFQDDLAGEVETCSHLFRFKVCPQCGEENDISARTCRSCKEVLVDIDKRLKEVMSLKDAHVLRVDSLDYVISRDRKGQERLEIRYYDVDAQHLSEYFYLRSEVEQRAFYFNFIRMHQRVPGEKIVIRSPQDVINQKLKFRSPIFVVARKNKHYWMIREKIFDA